MADGQTPVHGSNARRTRLHRHGPLSLESEVRWHLIMWSLQYAKVLPLFVETSNLNHHHHDHQHPKLQSAVHEYLVTSSGRQRFMHNCTTSAPHLSHGRNHAHRCCFNSTKQALTSTARQQDHHHHRQHKHHGHSQPPPPATSANPPHPPVAPPLKARKQNHASNITKLPPTQATGS